ncbi:MAG: aldehyde dehydrogenase family protein [Ignavibacteria bacterium]|nr:aldehyde dehydrogenase family protein [Ignavibacteria bacterium]
MLSEIIQRHRTTLETAVAANRTRQFFAHWPEPPSGKIYGESANADGEAAFKRYLNSQFTELLQRGNIGWLGEEASPYGFALGVTYPEIAIDKLVDNATHAQAAWCSLSPVERVSVLIEALERASKRFFEIGYATMHTTGQGFVMAFQSSGPHGFDRALEAAAMGYTAQADLSPDVMWTKPIGKLDVSIEKRYRILPKGINLVIGCSTFPVWNSVPGIFAGLVTGNAVIVKPHPGAVFPIAIVVAEIQHTLQDLGLDPHTVQLAVDTIESPITLQLVRHPAVRIIDYTGGPVFGGIVEQEAAGGGKTVFTEMAGVNCVIVDSAKDIDKAMENLAFSLSLYGGQMCTAPQNVFVVKDNGMLGDIAIKLREKIDALVGNERLGPGTVGAIHSKATLQRVEEAFALDLDVVRASAKVAHPGFEDAQSVSPLVLKVPLDREDIYTREWFGPISFVIETPTFADALERVARIVRENGSLTTLVYTTDEEKMKAAEDAIVAAGSPIAFNFDSFVWVNQSAAFSDFHGTGANPAGSATFADLSYVVNRFNVIGVRKQG